MNKWMRSKLTMRNNSDKAFDEYWNQYGDYETYDIGIVEQAAENAWQASREATLAEVREKDIEFFTQLYDDLLIRAETDSNGKQVVNLSHFLWVQIKERAKALNINLDE